MSIQHEGLYQINYTNCKMKCLQVVVVLVLSLCGSHNFSLIEIPIKRNEKKERKLENRSYIRI